MNMQQFPSEGSGSRPEGINPHIIIAGVIAAALLVFILQNTASTRVHFLFFSFSSPLWLLIVIVAVLAALLDGVVARGYRKLRGKEPKPKS